MGTLLEKILMCNLMNKKCKTCSKVINIDQFSINKGGKLGRRSSCMSCEKTRKSLYYKNNKQDILESKKQYQIKNKEQINKRNTIHVREKYQNNTLFRLKSNTSALIRHSMKKQNIKKGGAKVTVLLNCDIVFFRLHLESQFEPGMTWDNYGSYWSIDHICPCAQAKNADELIKLQHYSNLRPMQTYGPKGNFAKSDSKTPYGEILCRTLLNRNWID